jgi:hypothetical protein
MLSNDRKLIAVIGATGKQGGGVVRRPTYLGSDSHDQIALANKIAGTQPSKLSTWARANFPVQCSVTV